MAFVSVPIVHSLTLCHWSLLQNLSVNSKKYVTAASVYILRKLSGFAKVSMDKLRTYAPIEWFNNTQGCLTMKL